MFMTEFSLLLETLIISPGQLLITGDANFHVNDTSDRDAIAFLELLDSSGLCQHVQEATHRCGNTLDVIISRSSDELISDVTVINGLPSDHKAIKCHVDVHKPAAVKIEVESRNLRGIDLVQFRRDIEISSLCNEADSDGHDSSSLVNDYETVLSGLLDKHAPLRTRTIVHRPNTPWFDEKLRNSKREKRKYERKWLKSGLEVDHQLYIQRCKAYRRELDEAKCEYHRVQINECDDRQLFKLVDKLSHSSKSSVS
jgi:hypothetical protein